MRTDNLTETQIRDIETNGIDIGSEQVEKQRETEDGHKPKTVKGKQNEPKQKGTDSKTRQKRKGLKTDEQTDETVSHRKTVTKTDTWTKVKTGRKTNKEDR